MATPLYNYNPNTQPSVVAATASEGFFTSLQLAQDIPQVRRQLMQRHDLVKNWYSTLKELGLGSPLKGPELAHWEEDWITNNILIGAIVTASTGAGTQMIVALDAASMYATNLPGVGAQAFSYPAQWDILRLPSGDDAQIMFKDVSVTPHRLTLKPRDPSIDLAGKVAGGSRYWIYTNAFGEGTYGATPKIPRLFRWSNNTQIIKSAYVETGSSMTNVMPITNIDGMEGSFKIVGGWATEKLQMERISKALWWGKKGTNVTVTSDATGQTVLVKTTQGLDNYIEQNGTLLTAPAGGLDIDTFDSIGEIFERERISSKNILMPVGYGLHTQISNTLKEFMTNTAFSYAKNSPLKSDIFDGFSTPEDFFLWLDFSGIHKNGFNFLLRNQPELTEQMGAGTEGYNIRNTGYAMPIETFTNKDGGNASQPSLGYRYKALNDYSREYEVGYTGGAGTKPKTSSLDAMAMDIRSDIGGEYALGNHMIKIVQTN